MKQFSWYNVYINNYDIITTLLKKYETPLFIIDTNYISQKYDFIRSHTSGNFLYFYNISYNSDKKVFDFLKSLGIGFVVGSPNEFKFVSKYVLPNKIIVSNKHRTQKYYKLTNQAAALFITSSAKDVYNFYNSSNNVVIYYDIINNSFEDFSFLANMAKLMKVNNIGVATNYVHNIDCNVFYNILQDKILKVFNLYSNYFLFYFYDCFPVDDIDVKPNITFHTNQLNVLHKNIQSINSDIQFYIEIGRYLLGDAGIIITKVIDLYSFNGKKYAVLDLSLFNGFLGVVFGEKYYYLTLKNDNIENYTETYNLVGITEDPQDVLGVDIRLPKLKVDDYIVVAPAGVNTIQFYTNYKRLPKPRIVLL